MFISLFLSLLKRLEKYLKKNHIQVRSHFTDKTIQVKYSWTHPNHDPNNITEIAKGRLPLKIRQWIEQHVDAKLNWNAIKNLLRLDNYSLRRVRINLLGFG